MKLGGNSVRHSLFYHNNLVSLEWKSLLVDFIYKTYIFYTKSPLNVHSLKKKLKKIYEV